MPDLDPLAELRRDLRSAAQFLREYDRDSNPTSGLNKTYDNFFAEQIEKLAVDVQVDNELVLGELWGIFAPTLSWDDAHGDAQIANRIFEKVNELYRPYYLKELDSQ